MSRLLVFIAMLVAGTLSFFATMHLLPDQKGGQSTTVATPKATVAAESSVTTSPAVAGKGAPDAAMRAEIMDVVKHVEVMKVAIERYKAETGKLPTSDKLVTVASLLAPLVPKFIADTRAPLRTLGVQGSFLVRSDGNDYKLIMHGAKFCEPARHVAPGLVDPVRNWPKDNTCEGFGVWSAGGAQW